MSNNNDRYSRIITTDKPSQNGSEPQRPSAWLIVFEAILLAAFIALAVMFTSFLFVDYHVNYNSILRPNPAAIDAESSAFLDTIPEPSLPQTSTDPTDPSDTDGINDSQGHVPSADYDWSNPVPESEPRAIESFDNAVFIGDSRMAGLILYTKLQPYNYSATGININQLRTNKYIKYTDESGNSEKITCLEALELTKGDYHSVYISVGTNELGWNVNVFTSGLKSFVESVKEIVNVPIYIQLVLPVTPKYEQKSQFGINNANVTLFNEKIRELAKDMQLYLLDPLSQFIIEDGTLDPEKTSDGVHLNPAACKEMAEFYQTHVIDTEVGQNPESPNGTPTVKPEATALERPNKATTQESVEATATDTLVIDAPIVDAPITDAPVTDTPVTDTPVTDAPVTDTPVTDTPVTDAPVTDAPVTDAPVTDTPVTDTPVTDAPVTDAPVTDTPVTDTPVTDTPVTDAPVTDTPVTDTPITDTPVTDAPVTDAPVTDTPVVG